MIQNNFPIRVSGTTSPHARRLVPKTGRNRKVSSEYVEGFFQRVLALDVPKFLKNSAASLVELPEFIYGFRTHV